MVPFCERWLCFGQPEREGLRSLPDTISNNITRNLIEIFLREYRNVLSGCSENTGYRWCFTVTQYMKIEPYF